MNRSNEWSTLVRGFKSMHCPGNHFFPLYNVFRNWHLSLETFFFCCRFYICCSPVSYRVSSSVFSHWTQPTFGPCWWMFLCVFLQKIVGILLLIHSEPEASPTSPPDTDILSFHPKADSHKNIWSDLNSFQIGFYKKVKKSESPNAEWDTNIQMSQSYQHRFYSEGGNDASSSMPHGGPAITFQLT